MLDSGPGTREKILSGSGLFVPNNVSDKPIELVKMQDTLWTMLADELDFASVREIEAWLDGATDFVDIGFGRLTIDSYDGMSGGKSRTFRVRHEKLGEMVISRAALSTVLNDLAHALRRSSPAGGPEMN